MQMEEMAYDSQLIAGGISEEQIRHYGIVFQGKEVLIG